MSGPEQLDLVEVPHVPSATPPKGEPASVGVAAVRVDTGLVHLDREFEYLVPAELDEQARPGVRVRVRFAGQELAGFVVERRLAPTHEGRLAPLRSVVSPEPVLTPGTLALAERLAGELAGTVSDVLRLAIPPRHARAEKALPAAPAEQPPSVAPEGDAGDRAAGAPGGALARYRAGAAWAGRVAAGESPAAAWLAAPTTEPALDWPAALAEAAEAALTSGRGSVLVVPDARDVDRVEQALVDRLGPGRHVRLTADQGPQARYTAWLKVLRGHVKVVVGTRAAAYAPVHDLGLVAWWDDGDDLHEEPRAPYPSVRQVLLARADLDGAAVLVGGFVMTTEVARLVGEDVLKVVGGPVPRREAARVVVAGEGHDAERDGPGALAHIPSTAWRAAKEALAHGPVLVQVPRRGYLPSVACRSCRTQARCPACHGPLALDAPDAPPSCRWCTEPPSAYRCPECGGSELRASVIGARRTAEEIGRAFPGVRVITSGAGEVVAAVPGAPALVIATPGAEPVAEGGYAAVLLLDAWALLDRPALDAGEESLRRWANAVALTRPWSEGGVAVLCGSPAHTTIPAVEALVRWEPQWFAGRELAERTEVSLPPAVWAAQVLTPRRRVDTVVAAIRAEDDAAVVLGPLPVPGAEERRRLVVQAPWSSGQRLATVLRDLRAVESARKESELSTVRVGPVDT